MEMMLRCAPRLELRSPTETRLVLEDIDNIRKRYPQRNRGSDKINWVVACGGATKFLLDAYKVEGREIRDSTINDERNHKDLEIYLFGKENLRGKSRNPLDIFGLDFWGPLKRINYNKKDVPYYGFYVEVMNRYYFGFLLPQEKDVVEAKVDGRRIHTLSPEFIIASKLFSTRGIREGIDDEDALKLLQKFHLDNKYLLKLVKSSKFNFLGKDEVDNLEGLLESGDFFNIITNKIRERYSNSGLEIEEMPYNCLVNLLNHNPEYFKKEINENHLDWFSDVLYINDESNQDDKIRKKMNVNYLLRSLNPELIEKAINLYDCRRREKYPIKWLMSIVHRIKDFNYGYSSELNQTIQNLKVVCKKIGIPEGFYTTMYINMMTENIVLSAYHNVQLAKYSTRLEKMMRSIPQIKKEHKTESDRIDYVFDILDKGLIQ